LLRRFRYWGDYDKELAAYMDDARAWAARTPPTKIKILYVVFKDLRMQVTPKKAHGKKSGRKTEEAAATGSNALAPQIKTLSVSDDRLKKIRSDCQKYADWIFVWSHGRCQVEWDIAVINETINYPPREGDFWAFAAQEQIEKALSAYNNKYQFMIFFDVPTAGGIAYTQRTLLGAYTVSLSLSTVDFIAHEMAHHIFDANMERVEGGLRLNTMHGFAYYGWGGKDCNFGNLLNTYRNAYYYIYSPDMWSRFKTVPPATNLSHEVFSGRAYNWDEVKDDRYFKLPRLTSTNLNQLTGLKGLSIDAPLRQGYMLVNVPDAERSGVISKVMDENSAKAMLETRKAAEEAAKAAKKKGGKVDDGITATVCQLDNFIDMMTESAIVLATRTGQWLIVKIDLADIYVDMNKISGRSDKPLDVYGYMAEGNRAMIVMKAPDGIPVPADERGYFAGNRLPIMN